jgi:hypothetical protein
MAPTKRREIIVLQRGVVAFPERRPAHDEARDQGAIEHVGGYKRVLCDADWNTRP